MRSVQHPAATPILRVPLTLLCALLFANLAVSAHAATPPAGATASSHSCAKQGLEFSELLEPAIEAIIDGRPSTLAPAEAKAQAWWTKNRGVFPKPAVIDTAMADLKLQTTAKRTGLASRAALVAAITALETCKDPQTDAARLMLLDLAGMAGWLRAHGVNAPFPSETDKTARVVGDKLRTGGHRALADSLAMDVSGTLVIPVRSNGDARAANALLQRVDDVQNVMK